MSEFFFSPCPRGLEQLLAEKLQKLGVTKVECVPGGVSWQGDWRACYRVNLESRLATRVLWRVGKGRYRNEADIYRLAYGVTWAKWFSPDETIRVFVTAQRSPLKSLEFITLRIKDAVCDHFRAVTGRRPSVNTAKPDVRIHAFFDQDNVMLYLDTSGEPLYKRGFKNAIMNAPLKENLAAGILKLSGWRSGVPLIDPMCGSGTFLLEAAQMSLDIAPGLGRTFAFECLRNFDRSIWQALRDEAKLRCRALSTLPIYGSDHERKQIECARNNLDFAGLGACVELEQCDILERLPPGDIKGVMVTNPPYGVRLGELEALKGFYPLLGNTLKKHWQGWDCYFLSADTALPKLIGLKTNCRVPLFNGALECRLYGYQMFAGCLHARN